MRQIAGSPAARGLEDDAAILDVGGACLVLTHDIIAEGVHYLAGDPPEDVAWKLVAVNLSDLAAKGARPLGCLLGFTLGDADWDAAFARGLGAACDHFGLALLGGDTVTAPTRVLGLTAIGVAEVRAPSRASAQAGDLLYVSGTIGEGAAGLRIALGEPGPEALLARYRRPQPRLALGQQLAPHVSAMMDVSDGLLLDAQRMAAASGLALEVDLAAIPLSAAYREFAGEDRAARLAAATGGDDYELLIAAPAGLSVDGVTAIGRFVAGGGLSLVDGDGDVPLPAHLGYTHDRRNA